MHQEFADYFCLFLDCSFWLIVAWNVVFARMDLLLRRCQTNFCHLFFGLLDSSFTLILHASLVDCYLRGWWRGWWFWFLLSPSRGVFCRWRICCAAMWRGDEEGVAGGHVFLVTCVGAASPEASLCWVQSRASQNRRSPPPNWSFFLRFELL